MTDAQLEVSAGGLSDESANQSKPAQEEGIDDAEKISTNHAWNNAVDFATSGNSVLHTDSITEGVFGRLYIHHLLPLVEAIFFAVFEVSGRVKTNV